MFNSTHTLVNFLHRVFSTYDRVQGIRTSRRAKRSKTELQTLEKSVQKKIQIPRFFSSMYLQTEIALVCNGMLNLILKYNIDYSQVAGVIVCV